MVKTRKSADPEESVLRDTREDTAIEHYRHSADRPKPHNPPENYRYVEELAHLQFELEQIRSSCIVLITAGFEVIYTF